MAKSFFSPGQSGGRGLNNLKSELCNLCTAPYYNKMAWAFSLIADPPLGKATCFQNKWLFQPSPQFLTGIFCQNLGCTN